MIVFALRTFNYVDSPAKELSGIQICCFIWIPESVVGDAVAESKFVRVNQGTNVSAKRQVAGCQNRGSSSWYYLDSR